MEFPLEFMLEPGDPGYSPTWGMSTGKLGRVTFPPSAKHGGRRVRFFATPEDRDLVLKQANFGIPAGGKQVVAIPPDIVGTMERARIAAVVEEILIERGVLPPANVNASPHAAKLARELGIDLATVTGTGEGGQITKEDVRQAAG
uniref:Peripheral subunit-binding (PSBD) domain-containing protein n=1 Tax=viral metagenome TaxID=1070528 RepID=A0A6M3KK93_9ZZZZ